MSIASTAGSVVMMLGTIIMLLAAWGIIDFPSALARMHAATKSASLGLGLVAVGAGMAAGSWGLFAVGLLMMAFLFITAPISGHLLGRAAYLAGQAPNLVRDDLAGVDSVADQPDVDVDRRFSVRRWFLLVVVWTILWRDASPGVLVGGAAVAAAIEWMLWNPPSGDRLSPMGVLRFGIRYLGMVVASNARVAWEVVTPRNDRIREAIIAVPLRVRSPGQAIMIANAISYSPGSLTIELAGHVPTIYVHVLHFTSVEEIEETVRHLERLIAGTGRTESRGQRSDRPT